MRIDLNGVIAESRAPKHEGILLPDILIRGVKNSRRSLPVKIHQLADNGSPGELVMLEVRISTTAHIIIKKEVKLQTIGRKCNFVFAF